MSFKYNEIIEINYMNDYVLKEVFKYITSNELILIGELVCKRWQTLIRQLLAQEITSITFGEIAGYKWCSDTRHMGYDRLNRVLDINTYPKLSAESLPEIIPRFPNIRCLQFVEVSLTIDQICGIVLLCPQLECFRLRFLDICHESDYELDYRKYNLTGNIVGAFKRSKDVNHAIRTKWMSLVDIIGPKLLHLNICGPIHSELIQILVENCPQLRELSVNVMDEILVENIVKNANLKCIEICNIECEPWPLCQHSRNRYHNHIYERTVSLSDYEDYEEEYWSEPEDYEEYEGEIPPLVDPQHYSRNDEILKHLAVGSEQQISRLSVSFGLSSIGIDLISNKFVNLKQLFVVIDTLFVPKKSIKLLTKLTQLVYLSISQSNFGDRMDGSLFAIFESGSKSLETLSLRNIHVSDDTLGTIFDRMPRIKNLDLQSLYLYECLGFWKFLNALTHLENLYIKRMTIPYDIFDGISSLTRLKLLDIELVVSPAFQTPLLSFRKTNDDLKIIARVCDSDEWKQFPRIKNFKFVYYSTDGSKYLPMHYGVDKLYFG